MKMNFQAFIEQLGKESRFDRRILQMIYKKKLQLDKEGEYARYERYFQESWNNWVDENGSEDVADFFFRNGEKLFREWLLVFFPFYTEKERLILGFKSGGTPEDIVIHMFYRFSKDELETIDRSLSNNKITNLSRRTALTRIFLESFLAMRPIISKTVGYQYSLMVEESKFLTKAKGRILYLEIVARPHE